MSADNYVAAEVIWNAVRGATILPGDLSDGIDRLKRWMTGRTPNQSNITAYCAILRALSTVDSSMTTSANESNSDSKYLEVSLQELLRHGQTRSGSWYESVSATAWVLIAASIVKGSAQIEVPLYQMSRIISATRADLIKEQALMIEASRAVRTRVVPKLIGGTSLFALLIGFAVALILFKPDGIAILVTLLTIAGAGVVALIILGRLLLRYWRETQALQTGPPRPPRN
jgi:hypothetical protein